MNLKRAFKDQKSAIEIRAAAKGLLLWSKNAGVVLREFIIRDIFSGQTIVRGDEVKCNVVSTIK
jgi:hypothetical protein